MPGATGHSGGGGKSGSGENKDKATVQETLQAAQNASSKVDELAKSLGLPVAETPKGTSEPDLDKPAYSRSATVSSPTTPAHVVPTKTSL